MLNTNLGRSIRSVSSIRLNKAYRCDCNDRTLGVIISDNLDVIYNVNVCFDAIVGDRPSLADAVYDP